MVRRALLPMEPMRRARNRTRSPAISALRAIRRGQTSECCRGLLRVPWPTSAAAAPTVVCSKNLRPPIARNFRSLALLFPLWNSERRKPSIRRDRGSFRQIDWARSHAQSEGAPRAFAPFSGSLRRTRSNRPTAPRWPPDQRCLPIRADPRRPARLPFYDRFGGSSTSAGHFSNGNRDLSTGNSQGFPEVKYSPRLCATTKPLCKHTLSGEHLIHGDHQGACLLVRACPCCG